MPYAWVLGRDSTVTPGYLCPGRLDDLRSHHTEQWRKRSNFKPLCPFIVSHWWLLFHLAHFFVMQDVIRGLRTVSSRETTHRVSPGPCFSSSLLFSDQMLCTEHHPCQTARLSSRIRGHGTCGNAHPGVITTSNTHEKDYIRNSGASH